jgi:predicted acylesterase/phospholipase RssA
MRPRLTVVYGGGGPFAIAYGMGVGHALRERGVPLSDTPALGTSGGAWAAAAVLAGLTHERVVAVTGRVRLPDLRPGRLRAIGLELFGDRRESALWTSTVLVRGGRRRLLWGGRHPVADIVAASSAVPALTVPQRVGRRYYVDGGARSWVSADLASAADRLLVVAPGVAPTFGRLGLVLGRQLRREVKRWRRRTGGHVRVVRVEPELAERVTRWRHLFDHALAAESYARALTATREELAPGGRLHELLL